MKVVMIGADRSVKGGVSAVVNNLYQAGLDGRVDLTYIGTMVDGGKPRKLLQALWAFVRFVPALWGTDLVHVNMAADASCFRKMIFIRTARFFGKKILIHEHGGDFEGFYKNRCDDRKRERIKKTLNLADLFVVLSDEWAKFFAAIVTPEKIRVLENAVPVPQNAKTDYSSHNVLFLGRLCREKGIGELLDAVPVIKEQVPDFKLILGGFWEAGNESLKKQAESLKDAVFCPGWVSPKERERLFAECSIFVLPTWFEGQPVSLLEAMAAGLCCVASAVGGIPQIMKEGTGVLIKPHDSRLLAQTLTGLLQEEERCKALGMSARAHVCSRYDIRNYVDRLTEYYREIKEEGHG